MDTNKLKLIIDIVETGNLSLTAERMGYTQSGVSHMIKRMEADLGFPLFIRTPKGVTLSTNGEILLPFVRAIVAQSKQMEEAILSLNGLQSGHINIGSYSSIAINWLPNIIKKFQDSYPNITFNLKEGGLEELEEWLEKGIIDFAFLSKKTTVNYDFIPLKEDPLVAVLPLSYTPLAKKSKAFPIKKLESMPFILSETGVDYDISATLAKNAIKPNVRFSCKEDYSIISLVSQELGVSILPALMVDGYKDIIKTMPLAPFASRTVGIALLSEENLTNAAREFIKCAQETIDSFY